MPVVLSQKLRLLQSAQGAFQPIDLQDKPELGAEERTTEVINNVHAALKINEAEAKSKINGLIEKELTLAIKGSAKHALDAYYNIPKETAEEQFKTTIKQKLGLLKDNNSETPLTIPQRLKILYRLKFHLALIKETQDKKLNSEAAIRKAAADLKKTNEQMYLLHLAEFVGETGTASSSDQSPSQDSYAVEERLENQQNWIDRGTHQAKWFAVSCGTTMAGAILMLIAQLGAVLGAPWLFIPFVFISPLFVLWVSRANFWLSMSVGELYAELFAKKSQQQKNEEDQKYDKKILWASLFFSLCSGVIWGEFTYETTLNLVTSVGDKFSYYMGITGAMLSIVLSVFLIGKGLYDIWYGLTQEKRTNSRWIRVIRGTVFLALGVCFILTPHLMVGLLPVALSVLMGLYTFPTIAAVFHFYGKKFAVKNEAKENSLTKLKQYFLNLQKNVTDDKSFATKYRTVMFIGGLLAISVTAMLSPLMIQFLGLATGLCVLGCLLVLAAVGMYSVNSKNTDANKVYRAFVVLGIAAVWAGLTILLASQPITAALFVWLGTHAFGTAGAAAVPVSYAVVFGFGFFSTVWFYVCSSIGATAKIFTSDKYKEADDIQKNDPLGVEKGPEVDDIIEQTEHQNRTWFEKAIAMGKWCLSWINPFSTDKNSYVNSIIGANGALNSIPSTKSAFETAMQTSTSMPYILGNTLGATMSGFTASSAANLGAGIGTVPSRDKAIELERLCRYAEEEEAIKAGKTRVVKFSDPKENENFASYSKVRASMSQAAK